MFDHGLGAEAATVVEPAFDVTAGFRLGRLSAGDELQDARGEPSIRVSRRAIAEVAHR